MRGCKGSQRDLNSPLLIGTSRIVANHTSVGAVLERRRPSERPVPPRVWRGLPVVCTMETPRLWSLREGNTAVRKAGGSASSTMMRPSISANWWGASGLSRLKSCGTEPHGRTQILEAEHDTLRLSLFTQPRNWAAELPWTRSFWHFTRTDQHSTHRGAAKASPR